MARHIEVNQLWLQHCVSEGKVKVNKVSTHDNPADILTKFVEREKIDKHMKFLHCNFDSGRHHLAPK